MERLPARCVHRTVPDMPDITHEQATLGMRVVYRPYPGSAELGVIKELRDYTAFVLYLGDTRSKLTNLSDLYFWEGL